MRKAKIAILVTFIIVACFAAFALLPGPARPNLSIKLVGSTNDVAGVQVGVISVRNLGSPKIFTYAPCIEVRAATAPGGIACYGKTGHWGSMLRAGASGFFAIPVPTNHESWRVTLLVYNDLGAFQSIRRVFKGRRMPFDVQSDWIQDDK
jgi:hypothetical protein